MRPYVIVAPNYSEKSNGSRVLHYLCHRMNGLGVPAFMTFYDREAMTNPKWNTPIARSDQVRDGIVIYPEVVPNNPLNSSRVVRWLLNRPGYLGPPIDFGPDDYVISFSRIIDPNRPVLQIYCPIHEQFNPFFLPPKTEDLFYVGRADPVTRSSALELFKTQITSQWPPTHEELAILLRRARVLFSYYPLTNLILEATLCGTLVVVLPSMAYTLADLERSELGMNGVAWGAEPGQLQRAIATLPQAYSAFVHAFEKQDEMIQQFVTASQERWSHPIGSCNTIERTLPVAPRACS